MIQTTYSLLNKKTPYYFFFADAPEQTKTVRKKCLSKICKGPHPPATTGSRGWAMRKRKGSGDTILGAITCTMWAFPPETDLGTRPLLATCDYTDKCSKEGGVKRRGWVNLTGSIQSRSLRIQLHCLASDPRGCPAQLTVDRYKYK